MALAAGNIQCFMAHASLVAVNTSGLYCPAGDFYIDPWANVARAIITHAHGDHARPGSQRYLTSQSGSGILKVRLGPDVTIDSLPYGEEISLGGVQLSLHPAGHILGSAQVRLEYQGQVCVVSGDYKTTPSITAEPFESLRCHHFVSECTFGLPIYRWPDEHDIFAQIHDWWQAEQARGRTCVLLAYSLGKAQRILAGLDASLGPILAHGAILRLLPAYAAQGISFPPVQYAGHEQAKATRGRALVLAPPSAAGSPWIKKFGPVSVAMASGWMRIRGLRRRKSLDRGFVLSDHADWTGLNEAITATGAETISLTHGSTAPMQRWLTDRGFNASALSTQFTGEADEPDPPADSELDETTSAATPPIAEDAQ
jgi:putative mRNA 3-end processing factor